VKLITFLLFGMRLPFNHLTHFVPSWPVSVLLKIKLHRTLWYNYLFSVFYEFLETSGRFALKMNSDIPGGLAGPYHLPTLILYCGCNFRHLLIKVVFIYHQNKTRYRHYQRFSLPCKNNIVSFVLNVSGSFSRPKSVWEKGVEEKLRGVEGES
jgi:hypothetical protein